MEGRTVCALADAAAWPVRWGIKRFRGEFEAKCRPTAFAGADLSGDGAGDGAALRTDPVIAPGDFIFYSGKLWPEWKGQALIAAMRPSGLVRIEIDGEKGRELARYPMDKRIREIVEGPDGAIWLLEDKAGARLLELRPRAR